MASGSVGSNKETRYETGNSQLHSTNKLPRAPANHRSRIPPYHDPEVVNGTSQSIIMGRATFRTEGERRRDNIMGVVGIMLEDLTLLACYCARHRARNG